MKKGHMHRRLSLPTGTETLRLREADRQRRIARRLEEMFDAWGYAPVETPLVDFFEVYRRLLSENDVLQIYRAVDRQGEILALRSDTTLFLAKQLGLHLSLEDLPVRVYYHEQIVRAEERHDIASNEYQQAGVELVGLPGTDADAEVIILAMEALKSLGVDGAVVHAGSHAVLEEVLTALEVDSGKRDVLRETLPGLVKTRSFEHPLFMELPETYRTLLQFIGSREELSELAAREHNAWSAGVRRTLDDLSATISKIPGDSQDFRIDLSELGARGYYTGIAFSVYLPESNSAVLRGGRYDRLLVSFGIDAPAVGFSMFPRKLPPHTMATQSDTHRNISSLEMRIAAGREATGSRNGGGTKDAS